MSATYHDEQSPARTQQRSQHRDVKVSPEAEKAREDALRQELASVRKVNQAIEGVLESLQKAKANMKTVNSTVGAASQLLNTWTRILSQTEHNQRLILDPSWQGATQDITDIEEEAQAKQYAAERREVEEQERRAAAAQRAEEEERRRTEASVRTSKPAVRARGRVVSRGAGTTSTASAQTTASGNTSMLRAPSSSRGRPGNASRARGVRGK
ncbi:hypothetical protein LTR05_003024 [Lithohypha guttulata]|uniref:DASH complex subunit DUO1 n=1 Tax=Lithohypha guttulata TaxID=1690604 RepID=A0AAN7T4Z0_9EURO|nr:hypothetical protein LTR05_003024 [Lithohypha guttulata]